MAKKHSTRTCQHCEKEYTPNHGREKYCSVDCRKEHYKHVYADTYAASEKTTKVCKCCSAEYETHQKIASKFCSNACRNKHKTKRPIYGPFICKHCHKQYYAKAKDRDSFCSRECALTSVKQQSARRQQIEAKVACEIAGIRRLGKEAKDSLRYIYKCNACEKKMIVPRKHGGHHRFCFDCLIKRKAERIKRRKQSEAGKIEKRIRAAKRRAVTHGREAHNIDPIKVFERDKWTCHICKKKLSIKHRGTIRQDAPELDHIVSIADGGTHTWGNVACSCRKCNNAKGAASFGQLGLQLAA